MARTKKEVIAFLDKQVGKIVPEKTNSDLDGQCVTLVKALLEYLGAPNPYAARGHAKDAGNTYVAQGVAEKGRGEIAICINPEMGYIGGVYYGHIWIDIRKEANYESNGAVALQTTKNTRPFSQATQVINLDKYLKKEEDDMAIATEKDVKDLALAILGRPAQADELKKYTGGKYEDAAKSFVKFVLNKKGRSFSAHRDNLKKLFKL